MSAEQWIDRFGAKLLLLSPRLEQSDVDHIGWALWQECAWRQMEHSVAAVQWAQRAPVESTA